MVLPIDDETCTYSGCHDAATVRYATSWTGQPWHGCDVHGPAIGKALYAGLSASESVTEYELDRLTPRRG